MSKKIASYPGREITTEEVRKGKVLESIQKVEPRYNWAAGVAISRFLTELKNGKIIGRKCMQCKEFWVPPERTDKQGNNQPENGAKGKEKARLTPYSDSKAPQDA